MSFAMLSNLCGSCLIFLVFKIVNVLTIDFVASSNRLDVELQILYSQKNKSDDVNNLEYGIYDTFANYKVDNIDTLVRLEQLDGRYRQLIHEVLS